MENEFDTEVLTLDDDQSNDQNDSNESGTSNQFTDRERQLYARLQREKQAKKELEDEVEELRNSNTDSGSRQASNPVFEERLELIAKGYEDSEIDFIQKNGGKKALKDPMVMAALKARKDKIEAESNAINNVSSKSGVRTQYTEAQIAKMSSQEYQDKILRQ